VLEEQRKMKLDAPSALYVDGAYGLRQARYRGKAKVRLQNCLIGAACNIRRLFRRLAWLAEQGRAAADVAAPALAG
jgi:hypothetical protein